MMKPVTLIFYAFCLIILAFFWDQFFLISKNNMFSRVVPDHKNAVAYFTKMEGLVYIKPFQGFDWQVLSKKNSLHVGDSLFVAQKSLLDIVFGKDGTKVTIPEETIFIVTQEPPFQSKHHRSYDLHSTVDPASGVSGEHIVSSSLQANSLKVLRTVRTLPIVYPLGLVEIYAGNFPTQLSILIHPGLHGRKLWGYLWNKSNLEDPAWSGYTVANFDNILVPKPGNYVFQAYSDNEVYVSVPIQIQAKLKTELENIAFFPIDLATSPGDLTRIVD